MAYSYYQPYGNYYPQNYPVQSYQMTPQMTTQMNQNATGIIWVSGLQEAQMYPVAPNNAVALWEQSGKVIYLKSADATGKPTLRVFDLLERSETASAASEPKDVKTDYATKEELAQFATAVKNVLGDIEQMKGDLYGVAGRKKPVTKKIKEEEDDE